MNDETAIPIFPCSSPEDTLGFYETLGFRVTHRQLKPYLYLAMKRGRLDLHFVAGGKPNPGGSGATCLVIVEDVKPHHDAFAAALKGRLGRVPTAGLPRITRLREGQSRFTLVDPSGNSIIFIASDEPEYKYPDKESWAQLSPMERALETAANFRDSRGMDAQAIKALDQALRKNPDAPPIERARALAAVIELAMAMGDEDRARSAREQMDAITLSEQDREPYWNEFQAVERIERMLR